MRPAIRLRSTSPRSLLLVLLALGPGFGAGAARAWAQAEATAQPAETPATDPEGLGSRVVIHGFLSQAYAFTDGNQLAGIPKQGTAEYRTAAVQIRASMTESDSFVVQLSHERNGLSPLQPLRPDVKLDWVFYAHDFGATTVRVGRVPIPYGIYNEIRDVGTILPFYRPDRSFYTEGIYSTETVDGGSLSHRFALGSAWGLTADAYVGNWQYVDFQQNPTNAEKTIGTQLFLDTPVPGLRFGAGALHYDTRTPNGALPRQRWNDHHFSAQATFGRLEAEAETKRLESEDPSGRSPLSVSFAYARLGAHLTDKWMANVQYALANARVAGIPGRLDADRDSSLGLSWKLRSDLVLKAEYHWNKGYNLDVINLLAPAAKTQYGILSMSASF